MESLPELQILLRELRAKKKNQLALARESGVSQSVISRILNGQIKDPSYTTMQKLLVGDRQEGAKRGEELAAQELMNKVISAWPHDKLGEAWKLMKKENFSQLPVLDQRDRPIGSISESFLAQHSSPYEMERRIDELEIEDPFPTVGKNTQSSTVADILKTWQAVLVVERGKVIGIITPHDLIEKL